MGKIYQMTTKYIKWIWNISNGRKIDQMVVKYAKIFPCKILRNFPKLRFLVLKQTIWQPCSKTIRVCSTNVVQTETSIFSFLRNRLVKESRPHRYPRSIDGKCIAKKTDDFPCKPRQADKGVNISWQSWWRLGLVVTSPPATEGTGALGREIKSR
jgi:hypothetical protein